jgi:hypothetical protein
MEYLNESYKNRLKELAGLKNTLNESMSGKHLVVVDIQPEYQSGFGSMHVDLAQFIEANWNDFSNVTFLYNGAETIGMISEQDYQWWWMEEAKLNEEIINQSGWYDKGYAFFRYCMDSGMDDESTTNLVRYMISQDVNDSRDLDEEFWDGFIQTYGNEDIRELIEFSDDAINIPDLMEELQGYGNIVICGGGVNECLKEVEIALDALDKPYSKLDQFVYQEQKKR